MERGQKLANRVLYGKRATPYEVRSYFSDVKTLGSVLSAILAILLWPRILLGTKITINL